MEKVDSESMTIYTASDALGCKVAAVCAGYIQDPLVERMYNQVKRPFMSSKKSPIINRGYYVRLRGVKLCLNRFMEIFPEKVQVVNLGCGYDTFALNNCKEFQGRLKIFEVDFQSVIDRKISIIEKDNILMESCLSSSTNDGSSASATGGGAGGGDANHPTLPTIFEVEQNLSKPHANPNCSNSKISEESSKNIGNICFVGADLKNKDELLQKLIIAGLKPDIPTFILTECVLVYLEKSYVESLIKCFGDFFQQSAWLSYDMTNPSDAFGAMMLKNLTEAGFRIPGLVDFPTFDSLKQRFLQNSWEASSVNSMLQVFRKITSKDELKRIQKLEIFDEVEEWNMLMDHYGLTIATKGEKIEPNILLLHS